MAKIEQSVARRTGTGPSGINIPGSGFRQINTDTGLGDLGRTVTNIGVNIKKKFEDAEKVSQMSSLKVQTIKRFAELEKEYNGRSDYQNFSDRADKLSKFRQELESQITYKDVKNSFMPYFEESATRFDVGIDSLSRNKYVDADKAAVVNEQDNLVQVSSGMPKEKIMSEILPLVTSGVAGRVSSGVLDPLQGDALINKTAARVWDLHIENSIDGNSPNINAELEDDKNFPGLTPERREYWQDIGRAKAKSLEAEAKEIKVRDVYDAVVTKYDDPDEAIAFLLKPGNAKKLDMTSGEMNKVVSIIKDQRAELTLAKNNAIKTIKLAKETKEEAVKQEKIRVQGEIATNIFDFRISGDDAGRLDYIKSLPKTMGKEKSKLLDEYESDMKAGAKITTDPIALSEGQDAVDFAITQGKPIDNGVLLETYGKNLSVSDQKALVKYNKDSKKTDVKNDVSFQKSRVKDMYNRGDFGDLTKKKAKGTASKTKSDILLGLNEWIRENPTKDPSEYVNSKIDLIAEEQANKNLRVWWEAFVPGEQEDEVKRSIARREGDSDLARNFIKGQGYDINDFSEDEMLKIMNTADFNKYKTDLLKE